MSRRVMKTAGQRRRSPRISALDSKKDDRSRTCRAKRNLDKAAALPPLSKLAKQVWKGRDSPEDAECVEWRSLKENQKDVVIKGKASAMPAKHILELILDTLQRRDTYEIFAQPVDPDEVEEYYEIIKEPMDFGTMRAKLHEGMYQDLQQFEHDVFLIPENAMHFNSSATTYYRQARAIHDLANKVFHVLKTKPDSFVSEFSGTRRRSMRKAVSETKETLQCPSTSTFRKSNRKSPPQRNFLPGTGLSSSQEADGQRDTYSSNTEDLTTVSSCKPLALVNEGEIRYQESLMSYVKDLGVTAQLVARRKLSRQHESSNGGGVAAREFKTFRDFAPAGCDPNPFAKVSEKTDVSGEGEEARRKAALSSDKTRNGAPLNRSSRPVILALENQHSNAAHRFKTRSKNSCIPSTPSPEFDQDVKKKPLPLISHFAFDLPFFKARLPSFENIS